MILVLLEQLLVLYLVLKLKKVAKTESFHIQNILSNGQFNVVPKLAVRINDF
jgi:hypothetical protein